MSEQVPQLPGPSRRFALYRGRRGTGIPGCWVSNMEEEEEDIDPVMPMLRGWILKGTN